MKKQKSEQELKELIQKYTKLEQKNRIIKNDYTNILNTSYEFPKYKKLIGKYFKFQNLYSSEDKWWGYTKVINIINNKYTIDFEINTFEKTSNGKIQIKIKEILSSDFLFQIEISEKEYNKEKDKLLKEINSL